MRKLQLLVVGAFALAGCVDTTAPRSGTANQAQREDGKHADGRHGDTHDKHKRDQDLLASNPNLAAAAAAAAAIPTTYHGGPVMTGTVNVYLIFYGAWGANSATTILPDFVTNLSNSPYFKINSTYTNASGVPAATNIALASTATVTSASPTTQWKGTGLSDAAILSAITGTITAKAWPKDPNAVYFLLTSAEVNATSGFCTQYCGWHDHAIVSTVDLKYSFVGNADRCPASCAPQTTSPNGNPGADAMASILAHELEEAVTDPDLNAWFDSAGAENADKCAWTFGTTYAAANGSLANVRLGTRDYYIQQNWVNQGAGFCAMSLPNQCTTDAQCSDGNACNGIETCVAGQCLAGTAVNCSDSDACTTDSCNPADGTCSHVPVNCDDGNVCTDDSCNPATGCVHANNTVPCNDGSACTENDVCSGGVCRGTAISCDDADACTTDTCNPASGCAHAAVDCTGGNTCVTATCDQTTGCLATPVANGTACAGGGTCQSGTCITACPTFTGVSSSTSTSVIFALGTLRNVTADGTLSCPTGVTTDVDLYLESQRTNGTWRTAKSALGITCAEHVVFNVGTSTLNGTPFRWRVAYYAGASTTFSLKSCVK